jgi:hypothetical protein
MRRASSKARAIVHGGLGSFLSAIEPLDASSA